MDESQNNPQPPETDSDAGAVDALEAGVVTPSPGPSDTTAPPPAPEAPDGGEATGEDDLASEDPSPDPRIAELEAQVQQAAEDIARLTADLESANAMALLGDAHLADARRLEGELTVAREEAARASQAAQDATERLTATINEWGLEKAREKILAGLKREEFVAATPRDREQAAWDFTNIVMERLEAVRSDKGDWDVRGKKGTPYENTNATRIVELMCGRYSYLFKERHRGGSGTGGQYGMPYVHEQRPNVLEVIAARMKALRQTS